MDSFSTRLVRWYEKNKRALPWREVSDPYRIWLSEVILQQTRVDQGMSYYLRFTELFPTVHDLASASEDQVLRAWQGLGYYSRARNLQATARVVSGSMSGRFPEVSAELVKLKGIGPYTAAAIASFCFNEPVAVIDGNVMRVLARIFGVYEPVDSKAGRAMLEEIAARELDRANPGTHNQAIMEFGALHCTPVNPACEICPFADQCVALKNQDIQKLPAKSQKTVVKDIWLYYFFIRYRDQIYLRKRSGTGIWRGLYDFPSIESDRKLAAKTALDRFLKEADLSDPELLETSNEIIHILSHRRLHARFFTLELKKPWKPTSSEVFSIRTSEIDNYGVPRLVDKFLESVLSRPGR